MPLAFHSAAMTYPDGTHALEGIDLKLEEGELVGVVGPSGCGKSTLIRLGAGLLAPTAGSVSVDTRTTGVVFQDPTLLPWRSVVRNVELLAELTGRDRASRRRMALRAIALVGLTGFEHYKPRALSGGMRMRVSLARSLALEPSLFLFDEPFAALDVITRETIAEELLGIVQRERFTGMFITHSIREAVLLCNRVIVMSPRPGRIVAEHPVPFAYPRSGAMRSDARFVRIEEEISADLRRSMRP